MPPTKKIIHKGAEGKPKLHLMPYDALQEIARALEHGIPKYGKNGYRKGVDWTEYVDAALRHIYAFADGSYPDMDDESKLQHLAHAGASIAILIWLTKYQPKHDDR